jgi:hypothetical protein
MDKLIRPDAVRPRPRQSVAPLELGGQGQPGLLGRGAAHGFTEINCTALPGTIVVGKMSFQRSA